MDAATISRRFSTLTQKSRGSVVRTAQTAQRSPPPPPSSINLSRFATLSARARAAISRPGPAGHTSPSQESPSSQESSVRLGISVDEAWSLFGITKKRATREEVKSIYLKLVAEYHPDKNQHDPATATQYMVRINAAFAALKRHCKW